MQTRCLMGLSFTLVALALAGCGGSRPTPAATAKSAEDEIAGCWQDAREGMVLCLEERGYVLFLADGKWDRVIVDWAEKTPNQRTGRTRTPRPLWLDVRAEQGALVMNDGETTARLTRPSERRRAELTQKIARLPELGEVCDRAEACKRAALGMVQQQGGSEDELSGTRACIGYLNAVAAVLRKADQPVPPECGP